MLTSFIRGKEIKKSLNIGMIKVWPKITAKIKELMPDWNVWGELDDYDDTFYLNLTKKYDSKKLNLKSFIIKINTDTRAVWVQKEVSESNYNELIFEIPKNNVFVLEDIGETNEDAAQSIVNQSLKIFKEY